MLSFVPRSTCHPYDGGVGVGAFERDQSGDRVRRFKTSTRPSFCFRDVTSAKLGRVAAAAAAVGSVGAARASEGTGARRSWTEVFPAAESGRSSAISLTARSLRVAAERLFFAGCTGVLILSRRDARQQLSSYPQKMRVIALLATYNEERFIASCLEHLIQGGVEVFLIDNESSDGTVEIARGYLGNGLVGIENFPRSGTYRWRPLLQRKSELAMTLGADWFLHVDADEMRLTPSASTTLAEALLDVDRQGYNAVNFQEFTFVPTRENPDHDHPEFERTMRWYYPYLPGELHQLKAWKRTGGPVELAASGGHEANFAGRRVYPAPFPMRHYLFLSVPHAVRKFVARHYDPDEVAAGLHVARARLRPEDISLQPQSELREYVSDADLNASSPRTSHPLLSTPAVSSG
jgi:hypothetical protein